MNDQTIRKAFKPSFGALHRDARRLLQVLNDNPLGSPVAAHLPATFPAEFSTQIDLTAGQVVDQTGALGLVRTLTQSQAVARRRLTQCASAGRRSAIFAFPGQHALLHDEFQVGVNKPVDDASVLLRARKLLAACDTHASALASHGWSTAAQAALSTAIDAFAGGMIDQSVATDAKQGLTAQRNLTANLLYNRCRMLQSVADLVYPASLAAADATALEARARFLIGEFASRSRTSADSPPVTSAIPAVPSATEAPAHVASPLAA